MQVQIKFIARGSSSAFGNFAPGDVLRCSAEQARHFVEEAVCAKYCEPGQPTDQAPVAKKSAARVKATPAAKGSE